MSSMIILQGQRTLIICRLAEEAKRYKQLQLWKEPSDGIEP